MMLDVFGFPTRIQLLIVTLDNTSVIQRRRDILARIQKAMTRACYDMFMFTEESGRDLAAEYLLTVRVAEAIGTRFAPAFKVHLEMKTKKFATQCFPLYKSTGNQFRARSVLQKRREIKNRPGRIDVAVATGDSNESSVCAIEVKRLNPSDKLVREDLERNAAYFALRDEVGDRPSVEFTAFAALHCYRPGYREQDLDRARKLYQKRIRKIDLPDGVTSRLCVIPADKLTSPVCDGEDGEVLTDAYLMMGIIVVFHWAEDGDDAGDCESVV